MRWITILTGEANDKMKTIHNSGENKHRQPITMPIQNQNHWMDPTVKTLKMLQTFYTISQMTKRQNLT